MMTKDLSQNDASPVELREIIKWAVALLGEVIKKELGEKAYEKIETIRKRMADLRDHEDEEVVRSLEECFAELKALNKTDRLNFARAYTLMLELMNACENAYRSHRLSERDKNAIDAKRDDNECRGSSRAQAIIYVLTAHPTEARSPQNIAVFRMIQDTLVSVLNHELASCARDTQLQYQLSLAWKISVVRARAPQVRDEAEHIYSILFDRVTLTSLLEASGEILPVYIRTWVGGDKDGHPGVDAKVMLESLTLSRHHVLEFTRSCFEQLTEVLHLLPEHQLHTDLVKLKKLLAPLQKVAAGDAKRVMVFRKAVHAYGKLYVRTMGGLDPALMLIKKLLHVFPAMVVPLELRESSDVLMSSPKVHTKLAIDKMLKAIAKIARQGDPRWYARGFIVSMTDTIEHLRVAEAKVRSAFGSARIPVIPLFEQTESLDRSTQIVDQMIHDPHIGKALTKLWNNTLEIMVGYSDSSKEGGVFPSRLAIAHAMGALDKECARQKVQPLFFQGSGGSVDRGGGTVEDQTAWWPRSALKIYKVTIQGEMVERSLASSQITKSQIRHIAASASAALTKPAAVPECQAVRQFSEKISELYRHTVHDPDFLKIIERATPYSDLTELKLGSRPSRRSTTVSVEGLRAIPWVLCWTQTRVLFPTWWGVGSAFKATSPEQRLALRTALEQEPVFGSYVRALGFTLAKVELGVWSLYLRQSGLDQGMILRYEKLFRAEYALAFEFFTFVTGQSNLLWFRPWLGASIRLRSAMIHPLNVLQILAMQEHDFTLLRYTVTGISSGMMTTG